MHMCCTSSWKDLLNDKRYGDYENPILQFMCVHDIIIISIIKPNYLVCTEK